MLPLSAIGRLHSTKSKSGIRAMLSKTSPISQMPPTFRNALNLLKIRDLDSFESHFLGLEAFLKPWCYYRDNFLLLMPPSRESTTSSSTKANLDDVSIDKRDILRFYTNFYSGEMRYDPRTDENGSQFTEDHTKYGTFSTTHWRPADYEKMLSAWLLQEFRVGKFRNPFGFTYFELKNICTAWEEVIQPIIAAVRDSYDVRGRQFYGRLALFIEDRCPSALAFPEGKSHGIVPESAIKIPYRRRFVSKGKISGDISGENKMPRRIALTERDIAQVDTELMDVTEKYGAIIERPKFKTRIEDWLATQRERHSIKKGKREEIRESREENGSPVFGYKGLVNNIEWPSPPVNVQRWISNISNPGDEEQEGFYHLIPTGSVYHGIPHHDIVPHASTFNKQPTNTAFNEKEDEPLAKPVAPFTRKEPPHQSSHGVYTSIRNANPFVSEEQDYSWRFDPFVERKPSEQIKQYDILSPMEHGPPSAIPKPLFNQNIARRHTPIGENTIPEMSPIFGSYPAPTGSLRYPSYAGNGYHREITSGFTATKLPTTTIEFDAENNTFTQVSSIPCPTSARHFSSEPQHSPQHPHWADKHPSAQAESWITSSSPIPDKFAQLEVYDSLSEYEASVVPPIPAKNPLRPEAQIEKPPPGMILGGRIISKENIRAHLDISRDSVCVDLSKIDEEDDGIALGKDAARPTKVPLVPYNTHMFPRKARKGTPMGGWMK